MKDWDADDWPDRWLWLEAVTIGAIVVCTYLAFIHDLARRLFALFAGA